MSDFKNVLKGGWHPKGKDGGKESWRGDFKGINQVAGWVGKGKTPGEGVQNEHVSRPLATLKDPSSFGPPPKNVNYHGGAALPNEITPHRSGLGAPLSQDEIASARMAAATPPVQELADTSQKLPGPPLPYRSDRTGLRTDNLPAPPTHKDLRGTSPGPIQQPSRPTPNLPPRLPARQNSTEPAPPPYELATTSSPTTTKSSSSFLNQSAINQLGNAGVSVPGFGIGGSGSNSTKPATATSKPSPSLSGLQSQLSRMNTSLSNQTNQGANTTSSPTTTSPSATSPQPQAQTQPPSWQQTRSALTTANSAYKDPSSVSVNDAKNAAATAQSAQQSAVAFRQRHNETINAAQTRASQLNKKYNMTGRLNKFLEDANTAHDQQQQEAGTQATQQAQPGQFQQQQQQPQQQQYYQHQGAQSPSATQQPQTSPWQTQPVSSPPPQTSTPELTASISRKPPPPPPPKKPANMQAPPPVPLGTKPR